MRLTPSRTVFRTLLSAALLLLLLLPAAALAGYTAEYDLSAGSVTITSSGTYRIYQSSSGTTPNTITVNADCTVVLDGVNILVPKPELAKPELDAPGYGRHDFTKTNPFNINGTYSVVVRLADGTANMLRSEAGASTDTPGVHAGSGRAGLRVPSGASLIIEGSTGSLEAHGAEGHNKDDSYAHAGGGAGIGGDGALANQDNNSAESSGSVTIRGGIVKAFGGSNAGHWGGGGAGIGGGGGSYTKQGASSGEIRIEGGDVTAEGAFETNALGAGQSGKHDNGSRVESASTSPISISGGSVTLKGSQALGSAEKLSVGSNGTLSILGDFVNNGLIHNNGCIVNTGTFANNGSVVNHGAFDNEGTLSGDSLQLHDTVLLSDDYKHRRVCSVCGEVIDEAAHSPETAKGKPCAVCGWQRPAVESLPQTGDSSRLMLWLVLGAAACAGLLAVIIVRRRRR